MNNAEASLRRRGLKEGEDCVSNGMPKVCEDDEDDRTTQLGEE
jgi:hypothetical protein